MLKVRVIPCLDVKDGRVVKGINFLQLRDAGIPAVVVGRALYDGRFSVADAARTAHGAA